MKLAVTFHERPGFTGVVCVETDEELVLAIRAAFTSPIPATKVTVAPVVENITEPEAIKIEAPWTPEQVTRLNAFQRVGWFHPFTCGMNTGHRVLVATPDGWVCPDCAYTQNWAHAFMVREDWR